MLWSQHSFQSLLHYHSGRRKVCVCVSTFNCHPYECTSTITRTHGYIHTQNRKSVWTYTSPRCICALCASHTHTHTYKPAHIHTYAHKIRDIHSHTHVPHNSHVCTRSAKTYSHTHTPSPAHRHVKPMHDLWNRGISWTEHPKAPSWHTHTNETYIQTIQF